MKVKLSSVRLGPRWWVVGDEEGGPYGPYDTKSEADEDRRGVQRTFDNWDEPGFFTVGKVTFR